MPGGGFEPVQGHGEQSGDFGKIAGTLGDVGTAGSCGKASGTGETSGTAGEPAGTQEQSKGSQTADPELSRLAGIWSNLPQGARKAILDLAASMVPSDAKGERVAPLG